MENKTFYITTPIYYPSSSLHIGNAYCTVAADCMARYKRLRGYDVYLLTGTDEHGQKIERNAVQAGKTPQAFVDGIVAGIKDLWELLEITNDDFIRTTEPRHKAFVQKVFRQLYEQDDIYKGHYEGWYCTPCESFWTQTQLAQGNCPDCGRSVERAREEAYFLRLSKYADWLLDHIRAHPEFIQPPSRANEMIRNFIEPGLEDLCVSRTSFKWGIPVDFDPDHVVYVWIDALTNYISALGAMSGDDALYQKYWPADVHLVGKEIVRFHTIIWPIMLRALGLPQPKQVFGHGWLLGVAGDKISKSRNNCVDPVVLVGRYGVDAIRYFLMREMPFGSDGLFSNEALLQRINSDLANDLGNLVSRSVAMTEKYFDGVIPAAAEPTGHEAPIVARAQSLAEKVDGAMNGLQFSAALIEIGQLVSDLNKYIDLTMPWVLAKDEEKRPQLATVIYTLLESIRVLSVPLQAFVPGTSRRIWAQLGIAEGELTGWQAIEGAFGRIEPGTRVQKGEALFPRLDIKKEIEALETAVTKARPAAPAETAQKEAAKAPEISIDDFERCELRVARVLGCKAVEKSDKLLVFELDLGGETRTVVSGIAQHYEPAELIGKQVVLIANLKPVKLRGVLSQGMLLTAEDADASVRLLTVDGPAADGARVC